MGKLGAPFPIYRGILHFWWIPFHGGRLGPNADRFIPISRHLLTGSSVSSVLDDMDGLLDLMPPLAVVFCAGKEGKERGRGGEEEDGIKKEDEQGWL